MKLKAHMVKSLSGEYSRKVWLLKGALSGPQKLCLFLDAEYYLKKMDAVSIITGLQKTASIPPVTCLFVSNLNGEARHTDYTCNPRFSQYVAQDLVRWVTERCEGISERDNLICGLSLSGLASAYLALTHPKLFPYALCQSGSFWWNNEWLLGRPGAISSKPCRLWISVGDQELESGVSHPPTGMRQDVSQVVASERMAQKLKVLGCSVNFNLYSGGHAIEPWREELPTALKWLIGKDP